MGREETQLGKLRDSEETFGAMATALRGAEEDRDWEQADADGID